MKAQQSMNSPRCFPWLAWGLSAVLLGSAHGCGGGVPEGGTTPASTASKTKSEKPRIALIMKSLANEFFKTMAGGARKHQGEHSSEYELIVNGIKDERDLKRQVDLVKEMVAQRVDAIVIAPADSKALVSACKHAQEAGIAVVNIDNKLDSQVLADQGVKVPFVGPDNRAGAKMVGDYMAGKLKSGDKVAMLEGIKTAFNGQQRKLGFEDAMKDAGLPIVDSQSALWEIEPASKIASAMLSEAPRDQGAVLGIALAADWGWPFWLALVACLGIGGICGLANGMVSVLWSIPSYIVTLGMLEVARGAAYLVTDSETKYIGPRVEWIARPIVGLGISSAFLSTGFSVSV